MDYIYLASPYSHRKASVRQKRYETVVECAAALMAIEDAAVFCPIAHSHPIGIALGEPMNHEFWMRQDMPLLVHASRVIVLTLEGWELSRGVAKEIRIANSLGIPVTYMRYEELVQ